MDHELRNVGGLAAFMCNDYGNIFFVMKKDIEGETATGRATGT
jgi:hypothetical protein